MPRKWLFLLVPLALILITSCGSTQTTDQGISVTQKIDSNLYYLEIQISDDVGGYSQTHGSITGYAVDGYGSMNGAIWTDGKGLVRGRLVSLTPSASFARLEDEIIVKTTDFKVAALKPGDTVQLVCTTDYEPICSLTKSGNSTATCEDIWEFDYCRMTDFTPRSD